MSPVESGFPRASDSLRMKACFKAFFFLVLLAWTMWATWPMAVARKRVEPVATKGQK